MEEACSLCGRVLPYYTLRRCSRCGRPYCGDCLIFTWDRDVFRHAALCLNCARRRVSPRSLGGKYTPLSVYLARRARFTTVTTLSLSKIEEIIGDHLPSSASHSEKWWMNLRNSVQGQAWLDVGWSVDNVDFGERNVTFKRTTGKTVKSSMKPRNVRRGTATWRRKAPRPIRPRRRRSPSKTKISKTIARMRNIEREKATVRQYRGRFKPKPAFEKKLYKPDAEPK